jgi:quercetin dioxygenase-like cupin family protein
MRNCPGANQGPGSQFAVCLAENEGTLSLSWMRSRKKIAINPVQLTRGAKPKAPGMDTKNMTESVRRVCIVAFPGAEILDICGPLEVFAFANFGLQRDGAITEPAYQIEVLAEKPGPLLTSCGLKIIADRAYSEVTDDIDTLLIAGAPDVNSILCDPVLTDWMRSVAPRVRRVASVCTGAFLLAKAACSTDAAPPVTGPIASSWPTITHRYGSSRIRFSFETAQSLRRAARAAKSVIATSGLGWAQRWDGPVEEIRPGDVVWFPPGEKHWHGATPTTAMMHIAIQEALNGKAVD